MDITDYPRLYPKLRLSWSLYQRFIRKDIRGIFDYLTGNYGERSDACNRGYQIHSRIELEGIKNVQGLEKLIDMSLDYKIEGKVILERNEYLIVCKPDLYCEEFVIDWKTGCTTGYEQQLQLYMWAIGKKCLDGFIVPIGEEDQELYVKRGIKQYKRSRYAEDWEYRFSDMANDIETWIKKGLLNKYLGN